MKKSLEEVLNLLPRTKETGTYGDHFAVTGAVLFLMDGKDPHQVLDDVLIYLLNTEDGIKKYFDEKSTEIRNDALLRLTRYFPDSNAEG